jgi:hypothetical protein
MIAGVEPEGDDNRNIRMKKNHMASIHLRFVSQKNTKRLARATFVLAGIACSWFVFAPQSSGDENNQAANSKTEHAAMFDTDVKPLLAKYCLGCHTTKQKKGDLDLQRFTTLDAVIKDVKPWQSMIQQLETREMPPKDRPQPTTKQREYLIGWVKRLLDDEARSRAGDPGRVPLRRLSNTEYNNTIRDLTGVDLQPTRDFPADGAAGEGFTNAAEALSMSPALMAKYVNASKDLAAHAVLLPDGFRFSATRTRRDWTDESLARLRDFYWQFTRDGSLPLQPYVSALVRHRDSLQSGKQTLNAVAAAEKLSPKYLSLLWQAFNSKDQSYPLDVIQARWRTAKDTDVGAIVAAVSAWRNSLWNFVPIGSYRYGNSVRAVSKEPTVSNTQTISVTVKPTPGQSEVVLYLTARELGGSTRTSHVVWDQPRFEGNNLPTLKLSDYEQFGARFEVDYAKLFANTETYLAAAVESANSKSSAKELAKKHRLDEAWLTRWIAVLGVKPFVKTEKTDDEPGRVVPAVAWQLLNEKTPRNPQRPAINGWKPKGLELPILITNSSDKTENVPGRVSPHQVTVHPMPAEFVAVVWKSPIAGKVRVTGRVAHAHPNCGNGVAWWVEKKSATQSRIVAEGAVNLGKGTELLPQTLAVSVGDNIVLAIDARDSSHVCDLTEIALTLTEAGTDKPRVWDLAKDIADNVLDGNPHADSQGNKDVWSFVRGSASERPTKKGSIDTSSVLAHWRTAASNPARKGDAAALAKRLRTLLISPRPNQDNGDRQVYDKFASIDGPLLKGIDLKQLDSTPKKARYGLAKILFGKHPLGRLTEKDNLVSAAGNVIEIRLPAELFRDRRFVVTGKLDEESPDRLVQFQVQTTPPKASAVWDASSSLAAIPNGSGHKRFLDGLNKFRSLFPPNICYPHVIPLDEVVCLKTFHREDEPLMRLFLDDGQVEQIDRLWEEHRFITKYPVVENRYLPLFIGFVTQDQPKQLLDYFEGQRPVFLKRAVDFAKDYEAAAAKQLTQLLDVAAQAYRRPLSKAEQTGLTNLYQTLRAKKIPHEDAFRSVLARVFISPSFLLHLETSPSGKLAAKINDWELASRLSYFLWASSPDKELRQLAATGRLSDPKILAEQAKRMLKDDRVRATAIEFGTQWIHVRGIDQMKDKNEKLFPTFNAKLRQAIYEESILFFQDLLQSDAKVTQILDADYTYLNQELAQHYGIPNVTGSNWRRVEGVKKYGRGGILGLASVQSRQAGASRTSPVLRGNWVMETLLGEKLPQPPPNVPQLPEEETGNGGLTMRQVVERHVNDAACAICHERIDPLGFALEKYDAIGRLRTKDPGGLTLDSNVKLRDGTKFEGIDGLRNYLLTKKRDRFVRLFYQRLLGYALGRSVTLSDQPLLDELMAESNSGGISQAVITIVQSKQFRMIRGGDFGED